MRKQVGTYLIVFVLLFLLSNVTLAQQSAPARVTVPSASQMLQQYSAGQTPLTGSRVSPMQPGTVVDLSLLDAIDRGLKYNLGIILSNRSTESARAARLRALSELLPHLGARVGESIQQINLEAYGFPVSPGMSSIIGPFGVFDTRASTTEALSFRGYYNKRSADESFKAAQFSYKNTRDLVVLVVGANYLQALADASRVEAAQAQVDTSKALFEQATSLKNAGMVPGIDVLRSQVEYQAQQQRLLVAQNEYDKQMLALARVVGLPMGQQFRLTDTIPKAEPVPITLDEALTRALQERSDFKEAQATVRAAELSKKAATAERYPTFGFNGDYGVIGRSPGNSHGTFTAAFGLQIPIFEGGKIRADEIQAESLLQTRQAQLDDLRQRIDYEVRSAFLDVTAATKQLEVATSALNLAREQVVQARDRFAAGVSNTVEVVQAQEQQATAEENFISSLYAHNVAKLSLARAIGIAEDATKKFLGGKQ